MPFGNVTTPCAMQRLLPVDADTLYAGPILIPIGDQVWRVSVEGTYIVIERTGDGHVTRMQTVTPGEGSEGGWA